METKQCTNCKEYKNISEFSYRNKTTKTGIKKVLLPICKECNNLKSRDYYHKNKPINYVYRFLSL